MSTLRRVLEMARVCAALPRVELERRLRGPGVSVPALRERGRACRERDARERAVLHRAIAAVDARLPGGGNCYRRVMLEIRLDRGAASERVSLGIDARGGPGSGHAWLGDGPSDDGRDYESIIAL